VRRGGPIPTLLSPTGSTAMNLALGLMSFGFAVVMSIPLFGPMLLH
jgi:hypothetical protein